MNWVKKIFRKRDTTPIRLTVKAVIRWEQLCKKSFSALDNTNQDEVLSLFYVCTLSPPYQLSFAEFKKNLTTMALQAMVTSFERQTSITSQFQALSESKKKKKKKKKESENSPPIYLKDIVATLVMNGLDAHFALNEMELCDLPIFIQAYDQKIKDKLTAQRLWAFMQLSPHLEKGTQPTDIYPFAWEMEEDTISEAELEEGKKEFSTFLDNGLTT